MKKYSEFLSELKSNLTEPLKSLVENFWQMKSQSTEENLKEFLCSFKNYAKKFEQVIGQIEGIMLENDVNEGNDLISCLDT